MEGIKNFLEFINENWTSIITIVGLCFMIYKKVKSYLSLSENEKVNIALEQIRKSMLELVSLAEKEYGKESGIFKRSKVLAKIYEKYPILKNVVSQDELEKKLDEIIDENLEILNKKLSDSREFYKMIYGKYPEY